MNRLVRILDRALGVVAVVVFTLLTLDVLLGVASRYIFQTPVRWTEELATFLLVWLVFLGASLAYCEEAHLRIEMLLQKLHPDARRLAYRISHAIILAFALVVLTYGGSLVVQNRWASEQELSTLRISRAYLYAAVPLNGLIMAFFAVHKLIRGPAPTANDSTTPEAGAA